MKQVITIFLFLFAGFQCQSQSNTIVFQSDFGLKDGAVSAMKGVAFSVSSNLKMFDLTHEIPPYNIWEAAYRLKQTASFWPAGTVFVSVVDPGVGSERRSVVMKSKSGHYFVTPDNGTLTLVSETLGVDQLRLIDEKINRLPNSNASYTFHGRDVYSYTAARLASGVIRFEEVGPLSDGGPVKIPFQAPVVKNKTVTGTIEILDVQYGNLWTNIDETILTKLDIHFSDKIDISITEDDQVKYTGVVPFGKTFADVKEGEVVAYLNSLLNLSIAINQGSFSNHYGIFSGPEWRINIAKHKD
jgi:S-adenosylmethionine hydrolase